MRTRAFLALITAVVAVWLVARRSRLNYLEQARPTHKLILAWVPFFGDSNYYFGGGQRAFQVAGCLVSTCEITADRHRVPLQRFDALLFHEYEFYNLLFDLPSIRTTRQHYVFMTVESARRTRLPEGRSSGFYNITMTYRLDSDIPWTYFAFVDRKTGADVSPASEPRWKSPQTDSITSTQTLDSIGKKKKIAAWFASNCRSYSGREQYVEDLRHHGVEVDAYGACGTLQCPSSNQNECIKMVGEQYLFYLAFENSLCADYITEKVLIAYEAGVVPVVLSGANLTRFLPPGSYVDAGALSPKEVAVEMLRLASDRNEYARMLQWRRFYNVEQRGPGHPWPPGKHPFCKLCAALHDPHSLVLHGEPDLRLWWHGAPPNAGEMCLA